MKRISGLLLCSFLGLISFYLADFIPVGALAVAIIIGFVVNNLVTIPKTFYPGIAISESYLLTIAIALMGVNLNYIILETIGVKSILLIIFSMAFTFSMSLMLAKLMRWDMEKALLITIGNSICGTSAIAASEKILKSKEDDVGLSIALVNFLGIIGMILLPIIATIILRLNEVNSGLVIGNLLQSVGNVTAAGFSIGEISGQTAIIVKMGRILMLTPVLLILVIISTRSNSKTNSTKIPAIFNIPLFIFGFIIFSLIATFEIIPANWVLNIGNLSEALLIVAMVAIGLKINLKNILKEGRQALLFGSLSYGIQILFSLIIVFWVF